MAVLSGILGTIKKKASDMAESYGRSRGLQLTPYGQSRAQDYTRAGVDISKPINQSVPKSAQTLSLDRKSSISTPKKSSSQNTAKAKAATTFSKGQIINDYGNYSKGNAAKELGLSKSAFESAAKAAGYRDTQSYYNAYKSGQIQNQSVAPIQSVPVAQSNPSQGLLGGMQNPFVQKVYAQTPGTSSVSDTRASGGIGQTIGNAVDIIGTGARLAAPIIGNNPVGNFLSNVGKERNWSEKIAGGNTRYTGTMESPLDVATRTATNALSSGFLNQSAPTSLTPTSMDTAATPYGPTYSGPMQTQSANLGGTTADPQQYFDQAQKVAEGMTDDEIASALIEYDRVKAELANQQGFLGSQKESALAQYDAQAKALQAEIERRKAGTYESAKNAERANRNTLRALGILGSSAAGELLTRPLTQAEGSVAQLDQMWLEKQSELDLARKDLEMQYAQLSEQIMNDERFNEVERRNAYQQATTAANERLMQIEQQKLQWAQAIDTMNKQAAIDMAKIRAY